jgi:O-succinylbenzoic acid--CoA ligase
MSDLTGSGHVIWHTNRDKILTEPKPTHAYMASAYDFMHRWVAGEQDFILQTSGSTGVPKLVHIHRRQMEGSAAMTGKALQLGKGTRALVCLNTAYVAGVMMLVRGMELNWELTIIEPTSNPILNLDQQFDFTALVPMQLSVCLENKLTRERVGAYGTILLGGAPVSLTLLWQIRQLNQPVYQSYGMTETVSHVALRRLNGGDANADVYTLLPSVQAGVDERGCLHVAGLMTNGELIQTNDLVEFESDRTFRWLGRADNVINSGGVKIILDKVDEAVAKVLYQAGKDINFFSWYESDEKLGQKLVLFIEKQSGEIEPEKLLTQIRTHLSVFETPKHVYFADRFQKTATDKIDRRQTANMFFNSTNG